MLLPSHARGTMSVLRPEARHLSPAVGLALSSGGSHLLSRLFELEPTLADGALIETAAGVARWKGTPVCRLIRQLFHRQHPAETLKITANRSLPAAHLSPSLAGASHISHRSSHLSPLTSYLALLTSCLSLLASHLSPSLAAHVVGLANMASHPGDAAVHRSPARRQPLAPRPSPSPNPNPNPNPTLTRCTRLCAPLPAPRQGCRYPHWRARPG